MKELKKENVAVKVTAKNVNKLRKLFAMFPEEKMGSDIIGSFPFIIRVDNHWVGVNGFYGVTAVTQKQLRATLVKEHLKAGDWVVCENKAIGVTQIIRVSHVDNESIHMEEWADLGSKTTKQGFGSYYLKFLKRYATPEEIQYFDNPHAEVKDAFEKGAKIEASHPSDNVWQSVTAPKWSKDLQYRIAEVNPEGKWCKFWDEDAEDKTIRKYHEPSGGFSYPHKDTRGCVWRYYCVLPEMMQTQLSQP